MTTNVHRVGVTPGHVRGSLLATALIIMASASGTPVPAIAHLIAGHKDTVRDVIHAFNEIGLRALDPQWATGRPRRINHDDEVFIVATAKARPRTLGRPFTCWSPR